MNKPIYSHRQGRGGFTLVEAVVCTVIVSLMTVAALRASSAAGLGSQVAEERATGAALADDLLSAVTRLDYQNPDGTPSFGTESGETASNRATFDDVDDYNGWSETVAAATLGSNPIARNGWQRSVAVAWVNPSTLAVSGTETGVKRITVTVTRNNRVRATRVALRSRSF